MELDLFNFLDGLKKKGYLEEIVVNIRSSKDIDIIASTVEGMERFARTVIESNMYTDKSLNVKAVKQGNHNRSLNETVLALLNSGETVKIDLVNSKKLSEIKDEIMSYS